MELNDDFVEQIVTTKSAHGYESGDIIQLSLHYQVDVINTFSPNPQMQVHLEV